MGRAGGAGDQEAAVTPGRHGQDLDCPLRSELLGAGAYEGHLWPRPSQGPPSAMPRETEGLGHCCNNPGEKWRWPGQLEVEGRVLTIFEGQPGQAAGETHES